MPIIHLNGTNAETLLEDNSNAIFALFDAEKVIKNMEFNARDYYVVEGAWEKALDERTAHLKAIRAAGEYFSAIAIHCSGFVSRKGTEQANQ